MMRMLAVAWKEFAQLRRDRLTLGIMFAIPAMQFLLFGFAINTDVRHLPLIVLDQDRTMQSRELVRAMEATTYFTAIGEVATYDDIARALRTGAARAALVIRPRFAADLTAGRAARAQLVIDGTDPLTVSSASNAATGLATERAVGLLVSRLSAVGGPASVPLTLEPMIWYNPELRTAVYVVPGLVGVILTLTMVMLTSMGIARERERGTIEALVVSPVRRLELVVGKILPYIGIGYVQMTLVLLLGHELFGITLAGGLTPLYAIALLFIAANLAIGLFFSTIAQTQGQAMQMSFFFLLPNILLSGFMFPFEGMPKLIAPIGELLPLTHFLRIVRGLELKGASVGELSHEILWLAIAVVVLVAVSAARFKKRLG